MTEPTPEELAELDEVGVVDPDPEISVPKVPQAAGDDYQDQPEDQGDDAT